jgi:crossover junction endodeoxyribonuclease RuvC
MKILALDLGTATGWAQWDGARLESGVQVFDVKRGESPGMRYRRFNLWLTEMLMGMDLVTYEGAHHRGGAATEVAAGFSTRVQELCAALNIDHQSIHTATLKRWCTGKGNAKKPEMIAAVCNRWKVVVDDNEADAIALLYHALAEHTVATP